VVIEWMPFGDGVEFWVDGFDELICIVFVKMELFDIELLVEACRGVEFKEKAKKSIITF